MWLISAWPPVMMIRKIVWVVDGVLDAERRAEGADEEGPGADVDGAEHGDQAEQVEPGGDPAGAAVAEDRAPVIEAAGRRIGRADLRHGHGEDQARRSSRPASRCRCRCRPTPEVACASELMPPDRMQMIENEIAKLEKRLRSPLAAPGRSPCRAGPSCPLFGRVPSMTWLYVRFLRTSLLAGGAASASPGRRAPRSVAVRPEASRSCGMPRVQQEARKLLNFQAVAMWVIVRR